MILLLFTVERSVYSLTFNLTDFMKFGVPMNFEGETEQIFCFDSNFQSNHLFLELSYILKFCIQESTIIHPKALHAQSKHKMSAKG